MSKNDGGLGGGGWLQNLDREGEVGEGPFQLASLLCVARSYSFEMESEMSNRQGEDNREVKSKNTWKMRIYVLFLSCGVRPQRRSL